MASREHTTRPETATPVLEVRDTSASFDMERGQSRVLDSVELDIYRNEILGIVGESGSGKSMFASALLDAVPEPGLVTGDIRYYVEDDNPVSVLDLDEEELRRLRWEEISMVFQGAMSSFNPTQSIRQHFRETLRSHDYDVDEGMAHARDLFEDLYLDPDRVLDSHPHELSGGMSQRALIALSLVLEPEVLVMDEPTAALDLLMQRSILSLLENIQEEYDLTIVFITHDLPLVAGLADRLAVMYAFEFAEIGNSDDILSDATHPYTRELLKAVPNLDSPLSSMEPIEGSSPDPVNVPSGCSYHPRCPLSDNQCENVDPDMYDAGEGRRTACHYWEESSEAIPLGGEVETESVTIEGHQSEDPLVSLENVSVHFEDSSGLLNLFGESDTVHATDDANLEIYENDVVALVGESGCGKTTLGKTAIGLQEPTEGTVKYRGQDIWEKKGWNWGGSEGMSFSEIRRALQIIHQDPGSSLDPNRTVKATLSDPLKRWHPDLNSHDRSARIRAMLETVGMTPPDDYASRFPHQLSGGEKQRVALIRALLMNPDLILGDEAVSALDVSLRVEMMDLMLDLQEMFNTSYLFISHNLANARYFAGKAGGRIGVMYLGEIVEIGPAQEVVDDPQHPYTQVLKWSTASLEADQDKGEPPVRGVDIPDPVDPPSGCRFHTRCPYAREVCREEAPSLGEGPDDAHNTACFRVYGMDHEYWDSKPLEGAEAQADPGFGAESESSAGD